MRWNGLLCVILASVALVTGCRKKTIHPPSPRVFDTPLHQAVRDGDVKRVRSLIASGADLEAKTWVGDTALRHAVEEHQRGMVELLIANGADLAYGTLVGVG
jgi:ankyrin repeat protein